MKGLALPYVLGCGLISGPVVLIVTYVKQQIPTLKRESEIKINTNTRSVQVYRKVAHEFQHGPLDVDLTLVDLTPAWAAVLAQSAAQFEEFVPDGIHPGELGCERLTTPGILAACGLRPDEGPAAAKL